MSALGYSSYQARKIVDISTSRLDYLTHNCIVEASLQPGKRGRLGGAEVRRWTYRDLVILRVLASLRRAGLKHQALRNAATELQNFVGEFEGSRIVCTSDQISIIQSLDALDVQNSPVIICDLGRAEEEVLNVMTA